MTQRTARPDKTAQIMLPQLDEHGHPIIISCRLDELLETIGQRLRHTLWLDGLQAHEQLAMRVMAHLTLELRPWIVRPELPPEPSDQL